MMWSNNNYIDHALDDLLAPALRTFVHERFSYRYGLTGAQVELEKAVHACVHAQRDAALVSLDSYAVLSVMKDRWCLFEDHFDEYSYRSVKSYVYHLHNVRNRSKHKTSVNGFSDDEVDQVLATMQLLLVASGANNEADMVKQVKRDFAQARKDSLAHNLAPASGCGAKVVSRAAPLTHEQKVLAYLEEHPEGVDDDQLSNALDITPRQQVNAICNRLRNAGRISRIKGPQDRKTVNRLAEAAPARS